jgi:hypothetical protein
MRLCDCQFGGEAGFRFRSAMAKFCGNQVHAGNLLRQRQRNDQKFAQILQELNSNALCRRLELKDLLPTIMQRLTKYPLLIENLLKYSQRKQLYCRSCSLYSTLISKLWAWRYTLIVVCNSGWRRIQELTEGVGM